MHVRTNTRIQSRLRGLCGAGERRLRVGGVGLTAKQQQCGRTDAAAATADTTQLDTRVRPGATQLRAWDATNHISAGTEWAHPAHICAGATLRHLCG